MMHTLTKLRRNLKIKRTIQVTHLSHLKDYGFMTIVKMIQVQLVIQVLHHQGRNCLNTNKTGMKKTEQVIVG